MKHIKKILLSFCLIATVMACDNGFESINTNRNVPVAVTPDLLLSGVIRGTMNDQVNEAWGLGNIVVQHTAKIQFVNEDRYLWGERSGVWSSVYNNMRNVQNIIQSAELSEPVQNNYLGIALIMKSWMYSLATDSYGDIPYSEAVQGKTAALYTPKYDTQESIYEGILADLDRANQLLGTSNEAVSGDLLYNGSIENWRKLANSLKVRYLMRISNKKDVKAQLQDVVDNRSLFEGNEDNAGIVYLSSSPNQWPLYGNRVGSFDEFRLSKTLGDFLTSVNDPRLQVFARPTEKSVSDGSPKIQGIPNGLEDTQALSYNGGPQGVSRVGLTFACLVCNDSGKPAPVPNAAQGLLMTYSELQFLLAEARERNLITSGSAEAYYNNGVEANFEFYERTVPAEYGIDVSMPASYLAQAAVAYTGSTEEKLSKIGTQKWIALFFNGLEAWFDWRRTGYPKLLPGASNLNDDKIPVRYIYPQSEQSLNGANLNEAIGRQGPDNINTPVWWDK